MSSRSTELEIIRLIERAATPGRTDVVIGIGSDCAVVAPPTGKELVLTKDCLVEGVHFKLEYLGPSDLGYKAAISNLSDVGAAGATPRWALLGLGFRPKLPLSFYEALIEGLTSAISQEGVKLVGGDTVSCPKALFVCLTLIGLAEQGERLTRMGARPGDRIFSSSSLGDSMAGLLCLGRREAEEIPLPVRKRLVKRHIRPNYPVGLGRALLRAHCATSAVDCSDGLSKDLGHICEQSRVRCVIRKEAIPISRDVHFVARALGVSPLELALGGGEDYALLWTTPEDSVDAAKKVTLATLGHLPYEIGYVEEGEGIYLEDAQGLREKVRVTGFVHG